MDDSRVLWWNLELWQSYLPVTFLGFTYCACWSLSYRFTTFASSDYQPLGGCLSNREKETEAECWTSLSDNHTLQNRLPLIYSSTLLCLLITVLPTTSASSDYQPLGGRPLSLVIEPEAELDLFSWQSYLPVLCLSFIEPFTLLCLLITVLPTTSVSSGY